METEAMGLCTCGSHLWVGEGGGTGKKEMLSWDCVTAPQSRWPSGPAFLYCLGPPHAFF